MYVSIIDKVLKSRSKIILVRLKTIANSHCTRRIVVAACVLRRVRVWVVSVCTIILVCSTCLGWIPHQYMLVVVRHNSRAFWIFETTALMVARSWLVAGLSWAVVVRLQLWVLNLLLSVLRNACAAHDPIWSTFIQHLSLVLHILVALEFVRLMHHSLGLQMGCWVHVVRLVHGTAHRTVTRTLQTVSEIWVMDECLIGIHVRGLVYSLRTQKSDLTNMVSLILIISLVIWS